MDAHQAPRFPSQGPSILSKTLQLLAATVVIFGLAYLLGHTMLTGPLKGNDSPLHLAYVRWLDQYFPDIPHWYPLQGGGESLLHGYPILSHILVVLLHRLTALSMLQGYRLISFLTFPLTAMGIYLFGWVLLRTPTVGFIAAVFYLLAPVTWTWMYDWGFFAQSVGMVFLPFTLICFDRYLTHLLAGARSSSRRLWFLPLTFCLALATLTHLIVGAAALAAMVLYTLISSLTARSATRAQMLIRGLWAAFSSGVVVGFLLAFYLVPFYRYGQVAYRGGVGIPSPDQLHRLPMAQFFGVAPIDPAEILTRMQFPLVVSIFWAIGATFALRYSRKALAICLAGILGTLYVLRPELPSLVLRISPTLVMLFNFRTLLLVVMIFLPIGAAFGVWALARSLVSLDLLLRPGASPGARPWLPLSLREYVTAALALLLAGLAVVQLGGILPVKDYHLSYGSLAEGLDIRDLWERRADDPCILPQGDPGRSGLCDVPLARANLNIQEFHQQCVAARSQGFEVPPLCTARAPSGDVVAAFLEQCRWRADLRGTLAPCDARVETVVEQLALKNWPSFALSDEDPKIAYSRRVAALLPDESPLRIDVSPDLGRLAQDLTAFSRASQINSYTFQISLIHAMWGYQQNVFYAMEPTGLKDARPHILDEMAKWFGTEYVFLNPELDPVEVFEDAGWQPVLAEERLRIWRHPSQPGYRFLESSASSAEAYVAAGWRAVQEVGPLQIWRFPEAPGLATLTTRPTVLVISRADIRAYEPVFRLANRGAIPYEEALIVEGRERLDSYTLAELERFDALLLHGYTYKDSRRAWALLEEYVRRGGSLYVDTGWEWKLPEWQFARAPAVLPVSRLTWTQYGTSGYRLEDSEIGGRIAPAKFDDLTWEGQPWSVSGVQRDEVRDWGRVVLSLGGRPLIVAGQYGQGRVVWSGMNLVSHAAQSQEEIQLLHNLMAWLTAPREARDYPVSVTREDPDQVTFGLDLPPGGTLTLYWREAYSPDWHAYLEGGQGRRQELPVYRGGPGFMLIRVPGQSGSERLVLEYRLPLVARLAGVLSAATLVLLLRWALEGSALERRVTRLMPKGVARKGLPALTLRRRLLHWWEDVEV